MPDTQYDLVIGLDRSDRKADLYLIDNTSAQTRAETLNSSPEPFHQWLVSLRQQQPKASVAICLEQPAGHLIPLLETYHWITLYPINPISLQRYRETFVTSRAKDNAKDAQHLAELLLERPDKFKALGSPGQPDPPPPATGRPPPRCHGRAHGPDQPAASPAQGLLSAGFGALR